MGISLALLYLHTRQPCIVHGDIKDTNILVEATSRIPRAKLLDFGLARVITRNAKPTGGTLSWMAPEQILTPHKPPLPSYDVFSFGRLVGFIVTGQRPLQGISRNMIKRMARLNKLPSIPWPEESLLHCVAGHLPTPVWTSTRV